MTYPTKTYIHGYEVKDEPHGVVPDFGYRRRALGVTGVDDGHHLGEKQVLGGTCRDRGQEVVYDSDCIGNFDGSFGGVSLWWRILAKPVLSPAWATEVTEMTDSVCTQNEGRLSTVQVDWRKEYRCSIKATCPLVGEGRCWLERERKPLPNRLIPIVRRVGGEWLRDVVSGCLHEEQYAYRGTRRCKGCGIELGRDGPIIPKELVDG